MVKAYYPVSLIRTPSKFSVIPLLLIGTAWLIPCWITNATHLESAVQFDASNIEILLGLSALLKYNYNSQLFMLAWVTCCHSALSELKPLTSQARSNNITLRYVTLTKSFDTILWPQMHFAVCLQLHLLHTIGAGLIHN